MDGVNNNPSTAGSSTTTSFDTSTLSVTTTSGLPFSQDDVDIDNHDDDTIFALSSGTSASGQATAVAVIRLSGPNVVPIVTSLLTPPPPSGGIQHQKQQRRLSFPTPRTAALRKLYHPISHEILDQAIVLYFPAPHSYTGQDCCEIQCHGSRAVISGILDALASLPARYAEPGEFTQRAFTTGKLDLLQVEALADLLCADTQLQRQLALSQLDGQLSTVYQQWRQQLIAGLAHAEAVIDFGDDERLDDSVFDINQPNTMELMQYQQTTTWGGVTNNMQQLLQCMQHQLHHDERRGELIREGIKIAIVGPPNAGKSSLFNVLALRDAAIVSSTAGTTRDVLELALNLGGVKCILQDTAGVRSSTTDEIEQEGINRAIRAATTADLIVAMIDSTDIPTGMNVLNNIMKPNVLSSNTDPPNDGDDNAASHANMIVDMNRLVIVLNKADLEDDTSHGSLNNVYAATLPAGVPCYNVSCVTSQGIDEFLSDLTKRVRDRVGNSAAAEDNDPRTSSEGLLITRTRHRQHVQAAADALERFVILSQQGSMAVDMAAEELRLAASELGRITGAVDVEDVLDKLFADFCIGK